MNLAFALLVATAVPDAPVPEPKLTDEKAAAWDKLWADARLWSGPFQVELICRLLREPKPAVEFLRGKLPPIKLSEKEAKDLLARLGSEDEEEWKAAFRELVKRDVRLAMTLTAAWAETKTDVQRRRLAVAVHFWGSGAGYEFDRIRSDGDYTLLSPRLPATEWKLCYFSDNQRSADRVSVNLAEWQEENPFAFEAPRVRLMLRTLEQIGGPEARAVVERMAEGNPDLELTKEAAALARRMKTAGPPVDSRMAAGLHMLHYWQPDRREPLNPADLAAFVTHPEQAVAFLKTKLRPIKMTRAEAEALLDRLFGDDPQAVRAALRQFQRTDIRATMTLQEAWAVASSPDHRGRLVHAISGWHRDLSGDFPIDDETDKLLDYELRKQPDNYKVRGWSAFAVERLGATEKSRFVGTGYMLGNTLKDAYRNGRWDLEASGLHILDVIGTDAAVAVIKDVASGHPDAHPTIAAKWLLKRRGK